MVVSSRRSGRVVWFAPLVAACAVAAASCSLLLNENQVQCRVDGDCARFGSATCNLVTGFCATAQADAATADSGSGVLPRDSGTDGEQPPGDGAVPRLCPDLDNNRIPDCTESLLLNSDFASNVSGWSAEADVGQAFDARDGLSAPASGSLAVTSTATAEASQSVVRGSFQCARASALTTYAFVAQALLESGAADAATTMGAAFQFFSGDRCAGTPSGGVNIAFNGAAVTGWRVLQGAVTTPLETGSLAVRLVVIKPGDRGATRALFDNVLLRAR